MKLPIPIGLGDEHGSETDYRDQLPVNYTLVERQIKGSQGYLLSYPGLTEYGDGNGIDRGAIYNERQRDHLRISGESLISVAVDGVATTLGVISGSDQAILPYSFTTQGILADTRFWLYDGATLQELTDPDLGSPIDCVWINGVYFFTDGETLYHTRADSEFSIDPLAFATSEFSPDRTWALLKNIQNQVVVLNRYSTEWFFDTGSSIAGAFRFERIQGKSVKVGIVGTNCKAELDGKIFILGGRKEESPSIHVLESGREETVASREIDKILATYTESELRLTVLEARVDERQKYLYVRLLRHTLLFDLTIAQKFGIQRAWTIIKSDITGDTPWRGSNGIFDPRAAKWIYGDSIDGRLGFLDNTTSNQYGEQSENIFFTNIINIEDSSINWLELDTIPGFSDGIVTVFVSLSYNGVTYGKEYRVVESEQFRYSRRFIARRLGYVSKLFNFKFRVVSPYRTAFSNLVIDHD